MHVGERTGERDAVLAAPVADPELVAQLDPQLGQLAGLAVQDQVAEGVLVQDVELEASRRS